MIATELIARSTEMPTSTLNELGLRMKMMMATTMMARNSPPIRSAMSKVALPRGREPLASRASATGVSAGCRRSCIGIRGQFGRRKPGPARGRPRHCIRAATAAEDLVEFHPRRGDLVGHDRQQRLGVGQDHAVLEELGAGRPAEGRLVRPALVEGGDLEALLDAVELALRHVPADGEDLAGLVQALDRAVGVLGADVDVLDELDLGIGREERPVGVIGLARIVADVEAVLLGGDELGVGDRRLDRLDGSPSCGPAPRTGSGRRRRRRRP